MVKSFFVSLIASRAEKSSEHFFSHPNTFHRTARRSTTATEKRRRRAFKRNIYARMESRASIKAGYAMAKKTAPAATMK